MVSSEFSLLGLQVASLLLSLHMASVHVSASVCSNLLFFIRIPVTLDEDLPYKPPFNSITLKARLFKCSHILRKHVEMDTIQLIIPVKKKNFIWNTNYPNLISLKFVTVFTKRFRLVYHRALGRWVCEFKGRYIYGQPLSVHFCSGHSEDNARQGYC